MDRSRENSAENTGSNAVRSVSDAAATAAECVAESFDQGRAALADVQSVLVERTRECMHTTDVYVRENPWQAVGIAAGIGLILGLLMARR